MDKLIRELEQFLLNDRRLWYTLWLIKGAPAHSKQAVKILRKLNTCNPKAKSTFKYTLELLYHSKVFKNNKRLRAALVLYLKNYIPHSKFDKIEIAKYIAVFLPLYQRHWWTLWLIKTPTLSNHDQAIVHNFIAFDYSQNIHMRSLLTNKRIKRMTDNVNKLSSDIYREIPIIDKQIKNEILKISDDIHGFANLIETIDNQVPMLLAQIREEIQGILHSLDNVIQKSEFKKHSSSNNINNHRDFSIHRSNRNNQNNDYKIRDKSQHNIANNLPTKNKYQQSQLASENKSNIAINSRFESKIPIQAMSQPTSKTTLSYNIDQLSSKNEYEIDDKNNITDISNKRALHNLTSTNQSNNINNYSLYSIYIQDPNGILDNIKISLDTEHTALKMENKVFDLTSKMGVIDFKNYLEMGRGSAAMTIKYNDIINKFIQDTDLTAEKLSTYGLDLDLNEE